MIICIALGVGWISPRVEEKAGSSPQSFFCAAVVEVVAGWNMQYGDQVELRSEESTRHLFMKKTYFEL